MRINFYLYFSFFILSTLLGFSQKPINKSGELWTVWEEANAKLEQGKFDEAIVLYKLYEKEFSIRLNEAYQLKELFDKGERLEKNKEIALSLNEFKKSRQFKSIGSLTVFEKKIESLTLRLASSSNKRTSEQEKRILAYELAYQGYKKLMDLDTVEAKKLYLKAGELIHGSDSRNLKQQVSEGNTLTQQLTVWGNEYSKSKRNGLSFEEEIALLEKYRSITGIPVISNIESEVRNLNAKQKGKVILEEYLAKCEVNYYFDYLGSINKEIGISELSNLESLKGIKAKIDILKDNSDNYATVLSGYSSLLERLNNTTTISSDDIDVLKQCLVEERYSLILKRLESAILSKDELEASRLLNDLKLFSSTTNSTEVTNLEKRISDLSSCEGYAEFNKSISSSRLYLLQCKPSSAKKAFEEGFLKIMACQKFEDIVASYKPLRDSIIILVNREIEIGRLFNIANTLVEQKKAEEANQKYNEILTLDYCDTHSIKERVLAEQKDIKNHNRQIGFNVSLLSGLGVNVPSYTINKSEASMSIGSWISAGVRFMLSDSQSPISFLLDLEAFETHYSSERPYRENFNLRGITSAFHLRLYPINKSNKSLKPYVQFGLEGNMPIKYNYNNYTNLTVDNSLDRLNSVFTSIPITLGVESKFKKLTFFLEGYVNYGVSNIYNSKNLNSISGSNDSVRGKYTRFGGKLGIRFW